MGLSDQAKHNRCPIAEASKRNVDLSWTLEQPDVWFSGALQYRRKEDQ